MANHKSAIKRHKQSLKRNARNRSSRTRMKNLVKNVRAAIQNNDKETAMSALKNATVALDKSAGKGVIHWKKAARKVSRLTKAVNKIEMAEATQPA